MQLSARIEILTQATTSSPRPARLIITGDGDEYECENALRTLLSAKLQQPTAAAQNTADTVE